MLEIGSLVDGKDTFYEKFGFAKSLGMQMYIEG